MKKKIVFRFAAIILGVFAIVLVGKGVNWYNWSHLTAQERATKITERMAGKLDLTFEQKERVLVLNLEKVVDFEGKEFCKNHKHGHHGESNPAYQEWRNEMKEILTDEQERVMRL